MSNAFSMKLGSSLTISLFNNSRETNRVPGENTKLPHLTYTIPQPQIMGLMMGNKFSRILDCPS